MTYPKNSLIVIDVDGTLVDHNYSLLPGMKERVIELFEFNDLWCWSHGGKDYARKILKKHKLTKYFKKVLDKPFHYIDDLDCCGMERMT